MNMDLSRSWEGHGTLNHPLLELETYLFLGSKHIFGAGPFLIFLDLRSEVAAF